jgi:hypothetical protein
MTAPLHPRGNADTCIKCKKKFEKGDRVQMAFIVIGTGKNPHNPQELGATLSEEFEMTHINCADRQLEALIMVVS